MRMRQIILSTCMAGLLYGCVTAPKAGLEGKTSPDDGKDKIKQAGVAKAEWDSAATSEISRKKMEINSKTVTSAAKTSLDPTLTYKLDDKNKGTASSEKDSPVAVAGAPEISVMAKESSIRTGSGPVRMAEPASPGVKAGFHDDNAEYGAFMDFYGKYRNQTPIPVDLSNRFILEGRDAKGKPASGAEMVVKNKSGVIIARRKTYADGRAVIFAGEQVEGPLSLDSSWNGSVIRKEIDLKGRKSIDVVFEGISSAPSRVPVDICFLLDTTGSMGDEIQMLKETLDFAHHQLASLKEKPDIRFGMVIFKDRGDVYRTQEVPFTGDIAGFRGQLQKVTSGGGGDGPEALSEALEKGLHKLKWREKALKVIFVITDAPPKVYPDEKTYADEMIEAAEQGIKIVGVGASGLATSGEVALRQISISTMGWFVFMTYGEKGESEGGTDTSVSHHTGANWQVRSLDGIIVRFVRQELAKMDGQTLGEEDWLETTPGQSARKDQVLMELFDQGVQRLMDYSLVAVENGTPTAVAPMSAGTDSLTKAGERLTKELQMAVNRKGKFKMVERQDLKQLMGEQSLGLTGIMDEKDAAKVGKIIGAKLMVISSVVQGEGRLEVFLKLVKVETSEILSLSLLKVSPDLVK